MRAIFAVTSLLAAAVLFAAPARADDWGEGYLYIDSYIDFDTYSASVWGYSETWNDLPEWYIQIGVNSTMSSGQYPGYAQTGGDLEDGGAGYAGVDLQVTPPGDSSWQIQGDHYYYNLGYGPYDVGLSSDGVIAYATPRVTSSNIDTEPTWQAGSAGNVVAIYGNALLGVTPTITGWCTGYIARNAWTWTGNQLWTYFSVSSALPSSCVLDISLLGWLAQVLLAPVPPAISTIGNQYINDGGQGAFSVTATSGTATSFSWSYSVPTGTNSNNPEVTFTPPNAASTVTDGHWYATDGPCSSSLSPSYTITATVGFSSGGPLSGQASLQVSVPWVPTGGQTTPAGITGSPDIAGFLGSYWIAGPGTLARTQPQTTLYIPNTSQFYAKAAAHEQVHVQQFAAGGLFSGLWQVADLYAELSPLTDTTLAGLTAQINNVINIFNLANAIVYNSYLPTAEAQAYQVSDPIDPQFIYQSNCNNNP